METCLRRPAVGCIAWLDECYLRYLPVIVKVDGRNLIPFPIYLPRASTAQTAENVESQELIERCANPVDCRTCTPVGTDASLQVQSKSDTLIRNGAGPRSPQPSTPAGTRLCRVHHSSKAPPLWIVASFDNRTPMRHQNCGRNHPSRDRYDPHAEANGSITANPNHKRTNHVAALCFHQPNRVIYEMQSFAYSGPSQEEAWVKRIHRRRVCRRKSRRPSFIAAGNRTTAGSTRRGCRGSRGRRRRAS